ncbi:MAG: glycosyltransferase family 87 protein [Deltaproteobacteria bacterium]|nr:glycosyltransferase family 87 protein [Deltaproteobacteria bacterium]
MKKALISFIVVSVAAVLPPIIWLLAPDGLGNTYGDNYCVFELLGLTGPAAILYIGCIFFKPGKAFSWKSACPLIAFSAVSLVYLNYTVEYSVKSPDYLCFERAAAAVVNGTPLYEAYGYIYPPLFAQILAAVFKVIHAVAGSMDRSDQWNALFYLYQVFMFGMTSLAFILCFKLALRLGWSREQAALIVGILLLVNVPLFRNLRFQQVNLTVMNLILGSLLIFPKRPGLAGLLLAGGVYLKLYPILLFLPLIKYRQWKTAGAFALFLVLLLIPQTGLMTPQNFFKEYLYFMPEFPKGWVLRDNSWHSIFYNSFGLLRRNFGLPIPNQTSGILYYLTVLFFMGWYTRRLLTDNLGSREIAGQACLMAGLAALPIMLLISPTVWEHHLVLIIPTVIMIFPLEAQPRHWWLILGVILVFAVPVFELFPFCYNRLAGLLLISGAAMAALRDGCSESKNHHP